MPANVMDRIVGVAANCRTMVTQWRLAVVHDHGQYHGSPAGRQRDAVRISKPRVRVDLGGHKSILSVTSDKFHMIKQVPVMHRAIANLYLYFYFYFYFYNTNDASVFSVKVR